MFKLPRSSFALLFLFGCPDIDPVPMPQRPDAGSGLRLTDGAYELKIVAVDDLNCDGSQPQDLIGETIEVDIESDEDVALISFDGWLLEGSYSGSTLYAEGAYFVETHDQSDERPDDDAPPHDGDDEGDRPPRDDEGDTGVAVAYASEEDSAGSSGSGGGSAGHDDQPDHDDRPEEEAVGSGVLDLTLRSPRVADGTFSIALPRCSATVQVALTYSGPSADEDIIVVAEADHD